MRLHARNIAVSAGVPLNYVKECVRFMLKHKDVSYECANRYLEDFNVNFII